MENIQPCRKVLLLLSLIVISSFCFSQVNEQWVKRYNGPGNSTDEAKSLAVDAQGNVYVTGSSEGNYVTVKYNANGNELWVKRYNGLSNGSEAAQALAVDAQGNVYVTGSSEGDYATIKYDTDGNELWVKRYDGPGNNFDEAKSIAVDFQGNVLITGESIGSDGIYDYATIKYDANGNELWVKRYNGAGNNWDQARSIAVDAQGNVYVTGGSSGSDFYGSVDYATIKYDANGNELWVSSYGNWEGFQDVATFITVDALGNVYVTGESTASDGIVDYATVKYDASGKELWVKRYNEEDLGWPDVVSSIAVDAMGNVYVTGSSWGFGATFNYGTIKYDTNGNRLWVKNYLEAFDENTPITSARALSLAVDAQGNVYVTGESGRNYATIKYDTNGNELWVKRYDGPGNNFDEARSIAVDAQGNVYVTGVSAGNGTNSDYATIKYTQTIVPPIKVKAGSDQTFYLGYGPSCVTLSAQASEGAAPYQYSWSPGGGTSASIKICPTVTTTYTVTVTDANGQTASDQVKVNVIDVRCGNKGDKVLVCHKGKPLCIAGSAVAAHLKHGDQLGNCSSTNDLNSITENTDVPRSMEELGKQFRVAVAPNPLNSSAKLQYELPADGEFSIKVYDVVGREVATVVKAGQRVGAYQAGFDASELAKGVYYYRALLTTKQKVYTQTGKIMVVK